MITDTMKKVDALVRVRMDRTSVLWLSDDGAEAQVMAHVGTGAGRVVVHAREMAEDPGHCLVTVTGAIALGEVYRSAQRLIPSELKPIELYREARKAMNHVARELAGREREEQVRLAAGRA